MFPSTAIFSSRPLASFDDMPDRFSSSGDTFKYSSRKAMEGDRVFFGCYSMDEGFPLQSIPSAPSPITVDQSGIDYEDPIMLVDVHKASEIPPEKIK